MDVSQGQRDDTIRQLHLAAADGRLSLDEATERIEAARVAASPAQLDVLLHDLRGSSQFPVVAPSEFEPYPTTPDALTASAIEPGYSAQDPLILSAGWQGAKRTGRWRVPPYIRANSGVDAVKIDCLLAQPMAEVIDLEVTAGAGTVTLIVPEGWAVRIDRLGKSFGTAKSRVDETPAPGYPVVIVHGGVGLGSFKARHANWFERWRLKRRGLELPPAPPRDLR